MATDQSISEWEERLREVLAAGETDALAPLLEDVHAADLADLFIELEEPAQIALLNALSDEQAAELLIELEPDDRATMLDQLTVERTSDVLDEMYSDDAADVLSELPDEEVDALLERMEPEAADDVAELLRYSEDTAGGLMAKEYVHVSPEHTVAETLDLLRNTYADAEMIYDIYALDDEGRLLGVTTLRSLIAHPPETPMAEIMAREFISVQIDQVQETVAEVVRRHDLLAVPVLDDDGRLQGIVTVDDIGEVVQDAAAEDLLAVSGSEDVSEAPRRRPLLYGWRSGLLALAGAVLLALLTWSVTRELLSQPGSPWEPVIALLPLLLVLGITAAGQAVLAIDNAYDSAVERHQVGRIFLREVLAGAVLALIGGVLAGILLVAMKHSSALAVAAALPLATSLWTTSVVGALGAITVRRAHHELGGPIQTVIVVLALLCAFSLDVWLARLALAAQLPPG